MAIQGSTGVFDVRGLLAFLGGTGRTGRLVVQARPQVGLVALRSGRVVAAGLGPGDAPPPVLTAPDVEALGEVLVELVTLPPGRFAFHPDGVSGTAAGFDVDTVLGTVDELARGYGDDSGLPPAGRIGLVVEPGFEAVTVTEEHWEVVTAVGDGASLADVAQRTGLGLAGVRRRVAALVRLGLAQVVVDGTGSWSGPSGR